MFQTNYAFMGLNSANDDCLHVKESSVKCLLSWPQDNKQQQSDHFMSTPENTVSQKNENAIITLGL